MGRSAMRAKIPPRDPGARATLAGHCLEVFRDPLRLRVDSRDERGDALERAAPRDLLHVLTERGEWPRAEVAGAPFERVRRGTYRLGVVRRQTAPDRLAAR